MKETWYKMFGFILKIFIWLFTSIVNASYQIKCVFLNNLQCLIQPTLINLHLNEYSQGLHYYLFAVNLDRCIGSYYTFKAVVTDMRVSGSLVPKKNFGLIWRVVFKLGYLLRQGR